MPLSQEDFAKVRDLYRQIERTAYDAARCDAVRTLRRYANDPAWQEHRTMLLNLANVILESPMPE